MKVLFLCSENSARSIMAEALLKHHGKDQFVVYSAGTHPSGIEPKAAKAITHFGLSTDGLTSNSLDDVKDIHFDYVITLCDKAAKECDTSVMGTNCLSWDFPEPRSRMVANPYEKTLQELNERIKMFLLIQEKQKPAPISPTIFFKCLADEVRLKTLLIIAVEQEACVCEIMEALNEVSQPKVSRHLAQLRNTGILAARKHQQWVFYSLNPTLTDWMKSVITSTVVNEPQCIEQELARLNAMGDRPTRMQRCCN
ncbi:MULTISPECIES: metalloregulator ArsR/SmtB family transcription factor [Thalassotalea]|uniref:metalloregulator ArsR/SmtB family transcription factor n=1 Tax=Thalassotalea TaxID=1518149 RepID=UPI000944F50B|nr:MULTISPECIES: metalloregulator ArsR/SmtB family transcription factor [Thalassotalea]OKY25013.1 ArsR family transcriptional regulator [Thalassotalea sp. PP2-459]